MGDVAIARAWRSEVIRNMSHVALTALTHLLPHCSLDVEYSSGIMNEWTAL